MGNLFLQAIEQGFEDRGREQVGQGFAGGDQIGELAVKIGRQALLEGGRSKQLPGLLAQGLQ